MVVATVAATSPREDTSTGLVPDLAKAASYFLLSYLVAALAWVLIPAYALGWVPMVVTSGSMAPSIKRGDVVLIEPGVVPLPGHVVTFLGSGGTPVLHRLHQVNSDGTFTTRGDANDALDSMPVTRVNGVGRLLVPKLGFLRLWLADAPAVMTALAVAGLMGTARKKWASVLAFGILVGSLLFAVSSTFAATTTSATSTLATVGISAPTSLTASCGPIAAGSDVPVSLTWTASPSVGVTGYEISHDAPPPGGGFGVVGSTSGTSFVHTIPNGQLALDQAHTYQVKALIGSWSSSPAEDQVKISQVVSVYLCS